MTSSVTFRMLPYLVFNSEFRLCCRFQAKSSVGGDSRVSSSPELFVLNGAPPMEEREKVGPLTGGNEYGVSMIEVVEKKKKKKKKCEELSYCSRDMIRPDGSLPHWLCPVECGQPLNDSPVLLFLPGLDGTELGVILHQKALGRAFEIRCLHIPVYDQTPFEAEYASSPHKPIYLAGDSFGGCLALAVAARNPIIDLVVLLANPATSFGRSQLQPLLPLLEAMPDELHFTVPYLLRFVMGDPVKVAMVNIDNILPPRVALEKLSVNLTSMLPRLSVRFGGYIIPKETLLWKLKLLKSAVFMLSMPNGKDSMLPSRDEAESLANSLENCRVRYFKDNGHTLLLTGINLLTIIKGTHTYRQTRRHDYILDFLPSSMSEYKVAINQVVDKCKLFRNASSSVLFSTLDDEKIVRGLSGVPSEGPVLLVGYHMLMGLELFELFEEFLREKKIIAPKWNQSSEFGLMDWLKVFGAVPVMGSNLFKLLLTRSHVLLYPCRLSIIRSGEEYKLFWPEWLHASLSDDDVTISLNGQLVLDHNDLMRIPFVNDYIRETSAVQVSDFAEDTWPLVPSVQEAHRHKGHIRITEGRENANEMYLQVKSSVESCIAYLLKKPEADPYRSLFDRTVHKALHSPLHEIPAFEP
ncbi:hypothetical protein ACJRO7_032859 [Eucalyptus globulus]|uniref:Serine aminopeptidase S33 domain-containing protein n=1 Tax=Eucalyptus globulus TaxID=34317 RepID=A0ABD3JNI2_EUCGL